LKIIGVISDTHIPSRAPSLPAPVIEAFREVDLIIHAGDLVSKRTIKDLEGLAPLLAVAGNHDVKRFSHELPTGKIIALKNYLIGVTHGGKSPSDYPIAAENAQKFFKDKLLNIIIFGHTHQPLIQYDGRTLLLNPGSPTDNRHGWPNSFARLKIDDAITVELSFFSKIKGAYQIDKNVVTISAPARLPPRIGRHEKKG